MYFSLDQTPCSTDPSACCEGDKCTQWTNGHLTSMDYYLYGHFDSSLTRVTHGDNVTSNGITDPTNTLTCMTDDPVHNEITMCLNHTINFVLEILSNVSASLI